LWTTTLHIAQGTDRTDSFRPCLLVRTHGDHIGRTLIDVLRTGMNTPVYDVLHHLLSAKTNRRPNPQQSKSGPIYPPISLKHEHQRQVISATGRRVAQGNVSKGGFPAESAHAVFQGSAW